MCKNSRGQVPEVPKNKEVELWGQPKKPKGFYWFLWSTARQNWRERDGMTFLLILLFGTCWFPTKCCGATEHSGCGANTCIQAPQLPCTQPCSMPLSCCAKPHTPASQHNIQMPVRDILSEARFRIIKNTLRSPFFLHSGFLRFFASFVNPSPLDGV